MRYDTILEEISATPLYLFLVFVVVLAAMHLALVRRRSLSDIAWKHMDYVWLAAAALGLFAASVQIDRTLSQRYLENTERPRIAATYSFLREQLADPAGVCMPRQRSALSPANFDEIVAEQQALCKRAKEIAAKMPTAFDRDFPPLEATGFEPVGIDSNFESGFVHGVSRAAELYRLQQLRYAELVKSSEQSTGELVLSVLGPLLISFALALRVTKVSGEIKNARAKQTKA
jgi:hypothetical protein